MPAPLGKTPTKKMPKIEVMGVEDSQSTRSTVRFFRDRRIVVRYVDLRKQPLNPAQLRQFLDRLGTAALLEHGAADGTPADAPIDRGRLIARIHADAHLLRLPLVRYGDEVTAGQDETTWRAWLARRPGAAS
jgi:arsenate reductase-like glutaredoxin family protein